MPGTTPIALLHAVNSALLAALPDARAIQDGGPRRHRLALGLVAAEQASAKGTEAGCVAAITALAGVQDEARALEHADKPKVQRSAKVAESALQALRAIDWHVVPPAPVLTVRGFATVAVSTSAPVAATATLALSAPAKADVTVMVTIAGLAAADVASGLLFFPVKVPAGAGSAPLPVTFAAQALTADKAASLALSGPAGATLGTPARFSFALQANTVVQPPPTLTLTGPGDIAASTTAEVDAAATVTLSTPTDHDVTATYTLTGQQDGDLLSLATGPVVIPAGQTSATIALRVAPLTLTADRALSLALSGIAGAAEPFPAAVTFALKANTVVTTKGMLTFPSSIGTVVREATAEKTVLVEVAREGVSTHLPATIPAVDIALPPDVLKVVGPAEFGAGQRIGHAPMVLHPYGAGARLGAVRTTPGKADLVPTADFDLGSVPSQDFLVQDGQVIDPGTGWWTIPGGNLSGYAWNIGGNSTGWDKASVDAYAHQVGRRMDAFCAANHPGAAIQNDWAEFDAQSAINNNHSGFGNLLGCGVKGKTWHILNIYTWPVTQPLATLAVAGPHDAHYVQMGQNLRAEFAKTGLEDWQIALRVNKEGNQNKYIVSASQGPLYGAAIARFIKGVRQGYGMTSRGRLRFTFSPARQDDVGALEGFCSFDDDGSCLYDAASVSTHPASQLNGQAGKSWDVQVAAVAAWLAGDFKPGYSYINKNKDYSVKALVEKYDLAYSADEWSPRYDGNMYCAISDAAMQAMHDFFASIAPRLAWDAVFNSNVLTEQDICPSWSAASRKYKQLWGK